MTYYGDPIFRSSATAPFSQEGLPIFAGLFEATFQAGVGLTGGNDPIVRLDFSDDQGMTFSSEISRGSGKIGKYCQRTVLERKGDCHITRTIRLKITNPGRAKLIKLAANPELGVQ